jgi:hypothetical protein
MKKKRAVMIAVLAVAVAALVVPLIGSRTQAAGGADAKSSASVRAATAAAVAAPVEPASQKSKASRGANGSEYTQVGDYNEALAAAPSAEVKRALGLTHVADVKAATAKVLARIKSGQGKAANPGFQPQAGEPEVLAGNAAFSAAIMTTVGGRDTQFSEVALLADWDGRENDFADRAKKVEDFSGVEFDIDQVLTRTAISEHTIANGFAENIFYYGDSLGNVWVGADTTGDGRVDTTVQLNLPTILNAFGTINSDDQVTITGLAVNPVADLTSFSNVNGAFAPFAGQTGEILYVTYYDAESGLRLFANNQLTRSGVLAFPVADLISPAAAPPGIQSFAGFPVQVGGAFGVAFSVFANIAGISCDDDGSVYFQNVDLIQFTGGNIAKIASQDSATNQDRSLAVSGFVNITTLNPTNRSYGTASGPATQVNRATNYSGTSTLFGNIMALANGTNGNALYAAVSRSLLASDDALTRFSEGLFPAPSSIFPAGTPSMIISFADCSGAFDICSSTTTSPVVFTGNGLPAADGLADGSTVGTNFRIFVEGAGPDLRPTSGTAIVPGTPADLVRIPEFQVDPGTHNGLAVDEENKVYVVSGGAPGGPGTNPSPNIGEILVFEDLCPQDRRSDATDLRSSAPLNPGIPFPNPPAPNLGDTGDGKSDRFDHIFWQAPVDGVTLTPTGIAGLARGFLRYTNRLAPGPISLGGTAGTVTLGVTGGQQVLGDDASAGTIIFELLDPSHQVAGGDDQNPPFTGDDDDGAGTPALTAPLQGGFEFLFGGPRGTAACVWNGFFWNSNGNITFGGGDTNNEASVVAFRTGLPKIAPAWTDLNPNGRAATLRDFPVMALGFANVNAFKIRWINVPEFGSEGCIGSATSAGALIHSGLANTFSITLYDDGTGIDENANQPLNPANPIGNNAVPFDLLEGPTALRFNLEPVTQTIVGCPPRPEGTGEFVFDYGRMDLLGTEANPVIAGYNIGGAATGLNPPGLCETNLSVAALQAEQGTFGRLIGDQTAAITCACLIGEGTDPEIYELFDAGVGSTIQGDQVFFPRVDFDLRFEGGTPGGCTAARVNDVNRQRVAFFGIGCAPPPAPLCQTVIPQTPGQAVGTVQTTPTTTGVINALCAVQFNLVGCGWFPQEGQTTICQGFQSETGIPIVRPGKLEGVTASLMCDTNGDGVPDSTALAMSTPTVTCNLVRTTLGVSASFGANSSSAFPATCCGGPAAITVTTSFGAGDNNVFGPFTRTAVCSLNLGTRAPVVISVSPSEGNCAIPQDVLITGACFQFTLTSGGVVQNVTSVFALERGNTANRVNANPFVILNPTLIDALFTFGSVNNGKTFLIFVQGPGGISRNLTLPLTGFNPTQAGCPAGFTGGNEQGVQVTFTCTTTTQGGGGGNPPPQLDTPIVNGCGPLDRQPNGSFTLDVTGSNIKRNAIVTVGGISPKKVKFIDPDPTNGSDAFRTIRLIKKFCLGLPGTISIKNPGTNGGTSTGFFCNRSCPTN